MDSTRDADLFETLRKDVLRMFRDWVKTVPDPDHPFFASASGDKPLSARDVVDEIEKGTQQGNVFVDDWIRMMVYQVAQQNLQAAAAAAPPPAKRELVGARAARS